MGARERATYSIQCECGATGTAEWSENDGPRFLSRGPETVVEVSPGFEWSEKVPDGPDSFFWRKLVCKTCGRIPETIET